MKNTTDQNQVSNYISLFYNEFFPDLIRYAKRFIKDEEVIKDIVQESFLTILENKVTIKNEDIRPYLFTTVRNKSYNFIRDQKIGISNEYSTAEIIENCFLKEYMKKECKCKLKHVILYLTSSERKIINLTLKSYKNKEIAHVLNISINTVKTLKKRAYNHLRKNMSTCKTI